MAAQAVLSQVVLARGALTVKRSTAARSFVAAPITQKTLVSGDFSPV